MKKPIIILVLLLTIQRGVCAEKPQITMSSDKKGTVKIELVGSGTANIDWGDGLEVETITLSETRLLKTHSYSDNIIRTITIFGENITGFFCKICELKNLDVSNNPVLIFLHCGDNPQLKNLDVSKNVELKYLDCFNTGLTYLDVSNNVELEHLLCYSNNLTHLDVSNNTNLTHLTCSANDIIHLDVSKNIELQSLNCCSNKLTYLDVSKNVKLQYVECCSCTLTYLDVSKNPALERLSCEGTLLKRLNVSKNVNLKDLNCANSRLSASALNALFKSLPVNDTSEEKIITIGGNPGTKKCKASIAEKKGWTVNYQDDFG